MIQGKPKNMLLDVDLKDGSTVTLQADSMGFVSRPDDTPLSVEEELALLATGLYKRVEPPEGYVMPGNTPDVSASVLELALLIEQKLRPDQIADMKADIEGYEPVEPEPEEEDEDEDEEPEEEDDSDEVSEGEIGEVPVVPLTSAVVVPQIEGFFVTDLKRALAHFGVEYSASAAKGTLVTILSDHLTTQELLDEALEVLGEE